MTIDEIAFDLSKLQHLAQKPAGHLVAQDIDVVFGICHRHRIAPQETIGSAIESLRNLHAEWAAAKARS